MKIAAAAAILTALLAAPHPAASQHADQTEESLIRASYAAVDASVVRIRTLADLEGDTASAEPGSLLSGGSGDRSPLTTFGSGVVVGRTFADGRWEYLILTNHHVADVSNYVIPDGRFLRENRWNTRAVPTVPEESYLVTSGSDESSAGDILLVEVGRNVRGDMALLRTVGADTALTTFGGGIGYRRGEIERGAPVITSGYPYTGGKVLEIGTVAETGRPHELGIPHEDFTVDLPVEPGQSGSPVFLVHLVQGPGEPRVEFTLIGLLHAREGKERFMVPYELWKETLAENPGTTLHRMVH